MAKVILELDRGDVVLDVLDDLAPRTASFFLEHVSQGTYDGSSFYRSTDLGVDDGPRLVQAGPLGAVLAPSEGVSPPATIEPAFLRNFETTDESGLEHREGTVSLARDLLDTGHAIVELFVCLGAFPQLDAGGRTEPDERGFPAFGRVTHGLDIVRELASLPTAGATPIDMLKGQILSHRVPIVRAVIA